MQNTRSTAVKLCLRQYPLALGAATHSTITYLAQWVSGVLQQVRDKSQGEVKLRVFSVFFAGQQVWLSHPCWEEAVSRWSGPVLAARELLPQSIAGPG